MPLLVRWPGRIAPGSSSEQLVSLTDVFATIAEIVGTDLPSDGAEDSQSFLAAALGRDSRNGRTSLVSHSNHGEFAYRDGAWKLVFRNTGDSLDESRGQPRVVELYNLADDIAEERDIASESPERVAELRAKFDQVVATGASREGVASANDAPVQYDVTQAVRWAPLAE